MGEYSSPQRLDAFHPISLRPPSPVVGPQHDGSRQSPRRVAQIATTTTAIPTQTPGVRQPGPWASSLLTRLANR
jgi:hypothetical protein